MVAEKCHNPSAINPPGDSKANMKINEMVRKRGKAATGLDGASICHHLFVAEKIFNGPVACPLQKSSLSDRKIGRKRRITNSRRKAASHVNQVTAQLESKELADVARENLHN